MLLSKALCLDDGWVATLSTHNEIAVLESVQDGFSLPNSKTLESISSATIIFRCPLFVQLFLSKYGFTIIPCSVSSLKAYKPTENSIQSGSLEMDKAITDDISRTTDALLINPLSYQEDGCEKFVSQVITPINVYTIILVNGTVVQWRKLIESRSDSIPIQILEYIKAVENIISAYWSK